MQIRELVEYCERRGWKVLDEYVDVGISGAKEKRPELGRMMADAHLPLRVLLSVGDEADAQDLLQKGRPFIMRYPIERSDMGSYVSMVNELFLLPAPPRIPDQRYP